MQCFTANVHVNAFWIDRRLEAPAVGLPLDCETTPDLPTVRFIPEGTTTESSWLKKIRLDKSISSNLAATAGDQAFCGINARVARCDIEQRADLWLRPETAQTSLQSLVLLHVWFYSIDLKPGRSLTATIEAEGAGSQILMQPHIIRKARVPGLINRRMTRMPGIAALVKLSPGGKIVLTQHNLVLRLSGKTKRAIVEAQADGTVKHV